VLDSEWAYRIGFKPFADIGQDVFLVVSPTKINAFVASAEAVTQMTTRRNDFPKPLKLYKRIDIYGKNVLSTEGSAWRMHRRLTAPSFGEKNNGLVFTESIHHAQALLKLWTGSDKKGNKTVNNPGQGTSTFALYIISRAGFDVRVLWPHEEQERPAENGTEYAKSVFTSSNPPPGHKMDYRQAMRSLLENIMWTQIAPPKWLAKSPIKFHRKVGLSVIEWGQYMEELLEAKKNEVARGQDHAAGMDLFGAMIRGSGILDPSAKSEFQESDLMGNAFVLMVAGHETTANALHFSLIYLALNRHSQKRLQEDIDKATEGKPISEWRYEEIFPKLFDSMAAAVMNETLRVTQPIINIPKSTEPGRPQTFSMEGKEYLMPGDTHVSLCSAIHRNPKYWPPPPGPDKTFTTDPNRLDTDRWRPERWLATPSPSASTFEDEDYDDETLRGPTGADTSSHLFKPVKGSYIPFSDGYRSCIGRRFAQVEILVLFAVIFSTHSVELAVDEWASDAEVERMPKGGEERRRVWLKAAERADRLMTKEMHSIITLQLRGQTVPIRIVRRGEERFPME
jgi:cytochrome P450